MLNTVNEFDVGHDQRDQIIMMDSLPAFLGCLRIYGHEISVFLFIRKRYRSKKD